MQSGNDCNLLAPSCKWNQSNNEWNWKDEDEMTSSKYEPKAQSSVGVWWNQMIMVEMWVGCS